MLGARGQKREAVSHEKAKPAPQQSYGITLADGDPVSPEELLQISVFKGLSESLLRRNAGAVVRRRYRMGEIICREGDFGSTAFFILEGKADVFISTPIAHVKTEGGERGFFSRLKSCLAGRTEDKREEEGTRRWIPIDGPVDLTYDSPIAELGSGDLFGEMTCLSFYPRSATVRAATDCVMLEMLRNILDMLRKNAAFRAQQEQVYRRRALDSHLRSVPMFAELTDDFIDYLRERVELKRFDPGQVICEEDRPADSLYLVRMGFVKVSQRHPGGDLVLSYLPRGSCFGEIGLLGGIMRTATCTALDHVEVVCISAEDFHAMIQLFPDVRDRFERLSRERQVQNVAQLSAVNVMPLEDFLQRGLMEAQNLLVLDLEKCTRCDACVNACAESHDGITRLVREGVRFEKFLVATSCRQCADPLCMVGCPVGSIRRRNSLEVIIEDWCIGCTLCAKNCPYGNINMHPFPAGKEAKEAGVGEHQKAEVRMKATTCDLCTNHAEPSCVYACPHDAASRVDPKKFFVGLSGDTLETGVRS